MKKLILASLFFGFYGFLATPSALAVSLSFVPEPSIPEVLAVDIVISGLKAGGPPSLGAFDLDVSFDPAVLSPTDVTFGPFLGDPGLFEALTDFNFFPGVVDLAEVSLLSPADLDALQPASFSLAALTFDRIGVGDDRLAFSQVTLDDAFGNKIPEPSSLALFSIGAIGLLGYGWRRVVCAKQA